MKRLFLFLCFGVLLFFPKNGVAQDQFPTSDSSYLPQEFFFGGKRVPLEHWFVKDKLERTIRYYTGSFAMRERINSYFVASARYFPYLDSVLPTNDLSRDLKYIPVVESEFNCSARSRARAVGCWQFILATGRRFRLRVNGFVDERRDFEKSTLAAIGYLRASLNIFHDYFLAIAAYNAGDGAITRAVRQNHDSSFVNLLILKNNGTYNTETMDYLYQLWALKIIMENPERYGFPAYVASGLETETVDYDVPRQMTIIELARHFGVAPREFWALNPFFASSVVLRGHYRLTIPHRP